MTTKLRIVDGCEFVEHEEYGWVISGISRLLSLKDLTRYVADTDMTEVNRALAASHGQAAAASRERWPGPSMRRSTSDSTA